MAYDIAIASSDGLNVDRHFGHSEAFYIVEVDESGSYETKEKRELKSPCQHGSHDEDALLNAAKSLADCRYVLCEAIGPGAAAKLATVGVSAFETDESIEVAVKQVIRYDRRAHGLERKEKALI